jgi:hypothetical protein
MQEGTLGYLNVCPKGKYGNSATDLVRVDVRGPVTRIDSSPLAGPDGRRHQRELMGRDGAES